MALHLLVDHPRYRDGLFDDVTARVKALNRPLVGGTPVGYLVTRYEEAVDALQPLFALENELEKRTIWRWQT